MLNKVYRVSFTGYDSNNKPVDERGFWISRSTFEEVKDALESHRKKVKQHGRPPLVK